MESGLPNRRTFLRTVGAVGAGVGIAALGAGSVQADAAPPAVCSPSFKGAPALIGSHTVIPVQLVNITDLHGYLQPAGVSPIHGQDGKLVPVGGVGYLASHLKRLREGQQNSIFFSGGDNFTGWEHDGFWFRGEPVVEFLNYMGLDFSTTGNHEFDERPDQLIKHMIQGKAGGQLGEPGVDIDFVNSAGKRYSGTRFPYSCANLVDRRTRRPLLPPYIVKTVRGQHGATAKIGFINLTVPDTVSSLRTILSFNPTVLALDEVETANRYARELKARGVHAIVVNIHDGGIPAPGNYYDGCSGDLKSSPETGNAFDFARRVTPDIDLIFTGHQHQLFNCAIPDPDGNPRLVIEAGCYGQAIANVLAYIDTRTGKMIREATDAHNVANTHDITPDPGAARIADYWTEAMAERDATPLTTITADITATPNCCGESALGDLVADMELWEGRKERHNPANFSMVKTKYLPPQMTYAASSKAGDRPGRVLFAEATGDPYGKSVPLVNADLTGAQIKQILEEQWSVSTTGVETFSPLAVSANVTYSFDSSKPLGTRIDAASIHIDGTPLDPGRTYRVTGIITFFYGHTYADDPEYPTAKQATNYSRLYLEDRFAWVDWLRDRRVVSPPDLNRMTDVAQRGTSPALAVEG